MISLVGPSFSFESIEHIVFDKDGTITDVHTYWSRFIKTRAELIVEFYSLDYLQIEHLCSCMGLNCSSNRLKPSGPIAIRSREFVISHVTNYLHSLGVESTTPELLRIFENASSTLRPFYKDLVQPIFPAVELIDKLKSMPIKLSLVTSDTQDNAHAAMTVLGLESHFTTIIGGDSGFGEKKFGRPALEACHITNTTPENTIVIGDSHMDKQMSDAALCRGCILVASGQLPLTDLIPLSPYAVESLSSITLG